MSLLPLHLHSLGLRDLSSDGGAVAAVRVRVGQVKVSLHLSRPEPAHFAQQGPED